MTDAKKARAEEFTRKSEEARKLARAVGESFGRDPKFSEVPDFIFADALQGGILRARRGDA